MSSLDPTSTGADQRSDHAERAIAQEAADARATRMLIRIGIGALILLAIWIAIMLYAVVA